MPDGHASSGTPSHGLGSDEEGRVAPPVSGCDEGRVRGGLGAGVGRCRAGFGMPPNDSMLNLVDGKETKRK